MNDRLTSRPKRNLTSRSSRNKRAGMAPLEFIMGLPFLMGVMAIIWAVAYAGVHKTKVVLQARNQVWAMREESNTHSLENYKRLKDTKPLSWLIFRIGNEMPGQVSGVGSSSWETYAWLGGNETTKSSTLLITGTWDHSEVTEFNSSGPHLGVLDRIVGLEDVGLIKTLDQIISLAL